MRRGSSRVVCASSAADHAAARRLFEAYAASLPFDLEFQDFRRELETLPGEYAAPSGRLLLATVAGDAVGCVALRGIDGRSCEMKRLYVVPEWRRQGVGRRLVDAVIEGARGIGYERMLLDTVASMREANDLYRSVGFREIGPYRHNPLPGATFMELEPLSPPGAAAP